jgi:integrase
VRDAQPVEPSKRKQPARVLTIAEALHIFELLDTDEIAVRQDLPDIARYLAGTGNRTGEILAIRWDTTNLAERTVYIEGNVVRIKGQGLTINHGKTAMATRPIPLTDWLVDLLVDRRKRMAALQNIAPEDLTGWVFPIRTADYAKPPTCAVTGEPSVTVTPWVTGSPRIPCGVPSPRC